MKKEFRDAIKGVRQQVELMRDNNTHGDSGKTRNNKEPVFHIWQEVGLALTLNLTLTLTLNLNLTLTSQGISQHIVPGTEETKDFVKDMHHKGS